MDLFEQWVFSKTAALKLKVDNLIWIDSFFSGHSDMAVEIEIGGNKFDGRGTGGSAALALKKALSEAFERAVSLQTLSTTNGVAAHPEVEIARLLAFKELLERDSFLSHFYTNTPFEKIESPELSVEVRDLLSKNRARLDFFKMRPTNYGQGVIALIWNGQRWGGVFGMSFGSSLPECVEKALMESFRQFFHLQYRNELSFNISLDQFLKMKSWEFNDHKLLALNAEYFKMIEHLFLDKSPLSPMPISYDGAQFEFELLSTQEPLLAGLPLNIVRCYEESVQQLIPGPTERSAIYEAGLDRFVSGKNYTLNLLPHPFN